MILVYVCVCVCVRVSVSVCVFKSTQCTHVHLLLFSIGEYGLGRDHLPASIAVPLVQLSDKLNIYPFMEYAMYVRRMMFVLDCRGSPPLLIPGPMRCTTGK